MRTVVVRLIFFVSLLIVTSTTAHAGAVTSSASGLLPGDIQATVNAFKAALGDPNNANNPGPLGSGRREINWDGGGPPVINGTPAVKPFNVFRNTRGASFTTPGIGLTQTPITGGTVDIVPGVQDLGDINATYATTFLTFTPNRLFTPLGSNTTEGTFFVPGTNGGSHAAVQGFGAVFTDVDLPDTTSIQYFDQNNASLGTFFVPTADNGLSFLGVRFDAGELISRILITTGNNMLGPTDGIPSPAPGGVVDVVVMDDFLYSEPQAIPEPGTLLLLGTGLAGLAFWRKRRNTAQSQ